MTEGVFMGKQPGTTSVGEGVHEEIERRSTRRRSVAGEGLHEGVLTSNCRSARSSHGLQAGHCVPVTRPRDSGGGGSGLSGGRSERGGSREAACKMEDHVNNSI